MLVTLDVPYADTRAADLVWTLRHPPVSTLTSTVVAIDGGLLELGVLGASHQVVVSLPGRRIVETVACLPGEQAHLPTETECVEAGLQYRFEANVEMVPPDAIRDRVRKLRDEARHTGDGHLVLAAFPSDPHAVTALRLRDVDRGFSWDTWHIYPNAQQIVTTRTEVH